MTSVRAVVRKWRQGGTRDVARRVARRLYEQTGAATLAFPLADADVVSSVSLALPVPAPTGDPDQVLTVGWVCSPPAAGSGGHTTLFRMVKAFEDAGHRCVLLLHDPHLGDVREQERVVRASWPWLGAQVRPVPEGPEGFAGIDAVVASSWDTAHVVAARARGPIHRFYFVQDYEPFFHPRGYEYSLAEDSYRFGLTHVALGQMVARRLADEVGAAAHVVPFSVDTSVYSLGEAQETSDAGARSGVVLYAKPEVARRGYRLGAQALVELHRRRPDVEIHVYGEPTPDLGVPHAHHGRLTTSELADLYRRCQVGLGLSFTNISLVVGEMLAAGCVPVVNDSADARADVDHPAVVWALPTPQATADALLAVLDAPDPRAQARRAADHRPQAGWQETGRAFLRIVTDQVVGAMPGADGSSGGGTATRDSVGAPGVAARGGVATTNRPATTTKGR